MSHVGSHPLSAFRIVCIVYAVYIQAELVDSQDLASW